jgi:putrescine:ornithine antiporter
MATPAKKMSMMQLTVVVAVNMMGSGIIMLPTNMAKVGAISLLSWVVTALGSMAIAYGFAQAGIYNQRPGGMAAYAEDAHGKSGYFLTFFLYFFSLAIGNVAIAISAVGYLSGFFPDMSATPIATCISVIVLIWITTVANFGGPSITGKIGQVTVWGVIIPVAGLSVIGWVWFKREIFTQAWNPTGLHFLEGIDSSIALTLWAFLGMESAAQNSDAVENPKRDVPLACMFGTLGAAVVYVLSTTVIQGIVPNDELAKSTGPFALAYAKMFNPMIGSIIMGLAVLACVGSLLGWQFTIGRTAKTAADDKLFPAIFSRENNMGAPVAGMIVMGVVQTLMALSTISPTLSEQFSALVNLAVVTNVIPYIISLSALMLIMRKENVSSSIYTRNTIVAVIAMIYSTYAIYASGKDAVLGGTIVMALTFLAYGFLAPRFMNARPAVASTTVSAIAITALAALLIIPAPAANAQEITAGNTLERIKQSGQIVLGYRSDARPFAYVEQGKPVGYSVALCETMADKIKNYLGLSSLSLKWKEIEAANHYTALREGSVDLLCSDALTLSGMREIAFSIPVYPGGIGALLRSDAPNALKEVLSDGKSSQRPWRASPAQIITQQTLSAVGGSNAESWVLERMKTLKIDAKFVPAPGYETGVKQVIDRKTNVFFAERAILQATAQHSSSSDKLIVLDRRFTYTPIAMGMALGQPDLHVLINKTLSQLYTTGDIRALYSPWFGAPDADTLAFFRVSAIPE